MYILFAASSAADHVGEETAMTPGKRLDALRLRIAHRNDPPPLDDNRIEYLAVTPVGDRFHLVFHGYECGESLADLRDTLRDPATAACIQSLVIGGPDTGANGTRDYSIGDLVDGPAVFSELESFTIRLRQPEDHNRTIIGDIGKGVVTKLLERAQQLQNLVIPSAPDESFFHTPNRIEYLSVDAGYDTQGFIHNLGRFHSLPCLRSFAWGEYNETYMEGWEQHVTPFEDYRRLVQSPQFEGVEVFRWRNPACTEAEIQQIRSLRRNASIAVVRYSHSWR
jgi:hypothetical protein